MTEGSQRNDDLVGREIDDKRYHVRRLIGHGGMASVYLAHQRSVDRMVAIKFIQARLLIDDNLKKRFHREATVMASLTSPHCATIFDYGETDDGLLYIVMEHLKGHSLAQVLKDEGPLSLATFMAWMEQTCAGVQAAHRKGLVHRDLKPENLFVETSPDGRRIKVLDFGLAKIIRGEESVGDTQGLTRPGLVFGTPQYMSPEQAMGQAVDARTDIYAMGLIAYECLTGRPAFDGRTPQALLVAQATSPVPSVSDFRNDTPPHLQEAIDRALSKGADERFTTIDEFYGALCGGHTVADTPESRSETIAMVSPEALGAELPASAPSQDSLSPAALGTSPPATTKDNYGILKVGFVGLILALSLTWLMQADDLHSRDPKAAAEAPGDCSIPSPPAYDANGTPCADKQTAAYWSFNQNFSGIAAGLPPRSLKPEKPELVSLVASAIDTQAVHFVGESGSRLRDERPLSLGDRFTVEMWIRPTSKPERKCGQFVVGTASVRGPRQCYDLRIESGWALIIEQSTPDLFELKFHFMHQDLALNANAPTQVRLGGPAPLEAKKWNHVAVVSDGTKVFVMVNGRVKEFHRSPRIFEKFGYIYLGGYPLRTDGVLAASVDDLRLSDVDRSVEELQGLYQKTRARLDQSTPDKR